MTGTQHDRSSNHTPSSGIGMESAGEGHWQTWYTPSTSAVDSAGDFIRKGGLVAFPTETVYGLGGDAFNSEAVARIYEVKGRPGDNPLILHIAHRSGFDELAYNPPTYAYALMDSFWPGPLTLVAAKQPHLPHWLGGHPKGSTETIGIRMPVHPMARALVVSSGCVIAAPSANKAGRPSPTTAEHVADDYTLGEIDMILQGVNSEIGIESTVLDVTGELPIILRPGAITEAMIAEVTKIAFTQKNNIDDVAPRAPGMKYRHYAPKAPMVILNGTSQNIAAYVSKSNEKKIGVLATENFNLPPNAILLTLGNDKETIAQNLFARLRAFDKLGVDIIYAQAIPDTGLGLAIMDRMLKAAEGNVINV